MRYFNPIGADPRGRTGLQNPDPTHVLGLLIAAQRDRSQFTIAGGDWPTRDGSGLRDFIHVWDLARAHVRVIEEFDVVTEGHPFRVLNLGGGTGTTVRELVAAFERVTGSSVDLAVGMRRAGDVAGAYADPSLAANLLGWRAELTLEDGIRDSLARAQRLDRHESNSSS